MTKKTIVAFVYDFDHTLSTTDRQNYSFIPSLDIKTGEFWSLANERTKKEKRDPLLAYRYLRLLESKKRNLPITREAFQNFGKDIQFFSSGRTGSRELTNMVRTEALRSSIMSSLLVTGKSLKEVNSSSISRRYSPANTTMKTEKQSGRNRL